MYFFTDAKNPSKQKNIKESLQKWKEEKQKRQAEAKLQSRKPTFRVSRHVSSKPVQNLPATIKSQAYKNVAPRVVISNILNMK